MVLCRSDCIVVESATLRIHRSFVEPFPKLWARFEAPKPFYEVPSSFSSGYCLQRGMKHLSLDVGHVVVQWLYSGTYQPWTQETPPCPSQALKTAFGAYSVARQYDILGLETLAREQISLLGADTSVSTFVNIIQEAYPTTIRKDDWLKQHFTSLMKAAIKNETASTTQEETGEGTEDAPVANIIVKGLLDACREIVAEGGHKTPPTTPVEELKTTAEPASMESLVLPTPQTGDGSQATSDPVGETYKKPELEPALELKSDRVPEQPKNIEPEPHLEPEKK